MLRAYKKRIPNIDKIAHRTQHTSTATVYIEL